MKITTDHKWKPFTCFGDIPKKDQKDHVGNYNCDDPSELSFIIYHGSVYSIDDFLWIPENSSLATLGYHGYLGESYFSGVLIKLSDCGDLYQIASYQQ